MDSLTQIVLGAACGEIALGKKIGNKALLFGAIGGTIPDLDVFIGGWLYGNEIDAMAFHRGFMHSILFSIFGSFLFGWITFKLYDKGKREGTTRLKNWIWLFFLSIFTHPLLDSFTPYGTQLFLPFSDYRVAFNNISVVDPLYTLPFLLCLIVAMFYNRKQTRRRVWVKAGIYISSAYMLFTIGNKIYMDSVFKKSFDKADISYSRFSTQPTIMNNILWYGIAETENDYKVGFYSLLDKKSELDTILTIPKNRDLLDVNHKDIKVLTWFSNGYYNLVPMDSSKNIQYLDLRYPLLNPNNAETSMFRFELMKENNRWDMVPFSGKPPSKDDLKEFTKRFYGK
ncbi:MULTISPECIES: metal-dependent hydrolase [unclassified Tenacibaculum]|uniref:metal-dependent hydrolase n=1 Tax=unclassified Tenacibaculum TaxID=2635139 RepID=UPI001F3B6FEC|nr:MULTISPECIES: metal-dependent hydrolase [unclassified Tenacibaculum]MCF2875464.1 metal-dependent hydrolase [Tenacibaculum sp. Cn5-1]MCF2935540.1 metal-dependent hydrolase [Tenacibaculum sp. Cn5-34]MCG7512100.1 metal-dependent hydrolase [Tenacibaculum sp. Cn5-46]